MMRRIGLGLVCAAAVCCAPVSAASAASPCGSDWPFTQPAASVWQRVKVPSIAFPPHKYGGIVVRPVSPPPGKLPAVLIVHGKTSNPNAQCSVWWAARLLAAHGYVTMTINHPASGTNFPVIVAHHVDAVRSALKFLRSANNPYAAHTSRKKIGLVGHSLGGAAISRVQSTDHSVKAIVGLDNIRRFAVGDSGAVVDCKRPGSLPVKPRVPALGEASEDPCSSEGDPNSTGGVDFTDKRLGFKRWRKARVATMETVMKGFEHITFAGLPTGGPTDALHAVNLGRAGYYMRAWLDFWVKGDPTAKARLFSPNPTSVPLATVLSSKLPDAVDPAGAYQSSIYMPGQSKVCNNMLVGCPLP